MHEYYTTTLSYYSILHNLLGFITGALGHNTETLARGAKHARIHGQDRCASPRGAQLWCQHGSVSSRHCTAADYLRFPASPPATVVAASCLSSLFDGYLSSSHSCQASVCLLLGNCPPKKTTAYLTQSPAYPGITTPTWPSSADLQDASPAESKLRGDTASGACTSP